MIVRWMIEIRFLLLLLLGSFRCFAGKNVKVAPDGSQQPDSRKVIFVNQRQEGECGLYWVGKLGSGPRLFYGPLAPKGGAREIEGYPGQVFSLVESGTYERLAEYTISEDDQQQFTLTDEDVEAINPASPPSPDNHEKASACRSAASSCEECMNVSGCGWSVVRNGCFLAHPVATTSDQKECSEFHDLPDSSSKSVDAWLNQANALVLSEEENLPYALRQAYRVLEKATERAEKADALSQKKVKVAFTELSAKLEAVFDEQDAKELLESSRHEALAEVHRKMPMVDRRTLAEARSYIAQGKPVIITDAFAQANANTSPVAHKWTLEYLHRRIFPGTASDPKPSFNVAADQQGRCCRYFEPQKEAKKKGYPYPFQPTTHLYRDKFDGFVKTMRKAARLYPNRPRVLHYLHEIVMNAQGKAVVAGGPAPEQLVSDLDAVTSTLEEIASNQPFFGGFASAKLWMGQRGIIMPMHYDATDNLYAMAWGRKRAIVGPPGQLDAFYRYPNHGHPLVGSSQVNISSPDLGRFPRFQQARLQEVIVGPGDVLYLPAWWWHQFEQPFEDTAALNLWSRDRDMAPEASTRDLRIREHALYDQLERALVQLFANETGLVLEALANQREDATQPTHAKKALKAAAEAWRDWTLSMPGGHPKASQPIDELIAEYLETQGQVMEVLRWTELWTPGDSWDLSQTATLPRDLRERCQQAPETSPFMSYCD